MLKSNIAPWIRTCAKSVLVGCVLLCVAREAHAFELKQTAQGLPVHWSRSEVAFEIDPTVAQMAPDAEASVAAAAQAWSGADGAPTLSTTPAASASEPAFDGKNVVYFAAQGYAPAGRALAITILTYNSATGEILDADIVINGHYDFDVLPSGSTADPSARPIANDGTSSSDDVGTKASGGFDVQHVVAHEFGHTLGMSDELTDQSAMMYLSTKPGDATVRTLAVDDLDGISKLYYSAPSGHGCSLSPSGDRRRASPFDHAAFGGHGVGLAGAWSTPGSGGNVASAIALLLATGMGVRIARRTQRGLLPVRVSDRARTTTRKSA